MNYITIGSLLWIFILILFIQYGAGALKINEIISTKSLTSHSLSGYCKISHLTDVEVQHRFTESSYFVFSLFISFFSFFIFWRKSTTGSLYNLSPFSLSFFKFRLYVSTRVRSIFSKTSSHPPFFRDPVTQKQDLILRYYMPVRL